MQAMVLVGEDALCCALGQRLIDACLGWPLAHPAINARGITKLVDSLPRYRQVAQRYPVLCLADVDRGCAAQLSAKWRTQHAPASFLLRLAVPEAESWVLADMSGFADFLRVTANRLPHHPDNDQDPKRTVLNLARQSKVRALRQEMVSDADPDRPGTGYNHHLCAFVMAGWDPVAAALRSPSLARATNRLSMLKKHI
jgi:hypothetical protein